MAATFIKISVLFKNTPNDLREPIYAAFQEAVRGGTLAAVPLAVRVRIGRLTVWDELLRDDTVTRTWFSEAEFNARSECLHRDSDAVTFTEEEAAAHFERLAQLRQRPAPGTAPAAAPARSRKSREGDAKAARDQDGGTDGGAQQDGAADQGAATDGHPNLQHTPDGTPDARPTPAAEPTSAA